MPFKIFPTVRYSRNIPSDMPPLSLEWDMTDVLIWCVITGMLVGLISTMISKVMVSPAK
jgi:hypothetical protein